MPCTTSTTSATVRTDLNASGLSELPIRGLSWTMRSTASMLSMSRSSPSRASMLMRSASMPNVSRRMATMRWYSWSLVMACSPAAVRPLLLAVGGDERAQRLHAGEVATGVLGVGRQRDAVALLQGQAQFQRVDRVQAQALVEQRRGRVDVVRGHVLEGHRGDDEILDLGFKRLHWPAPIRNSPSGAR